MTTNQDFDAERYLRLLGEQELAEGKNLSETFGRTPALPEATQALEICGVITPELAREIRSDYALASLIVEEHPMLDHHRAMMADGSDDIEDPEPLTATRSHPVDTTLQMSGGRLELSGLTLDRDGGSLSAVYVSDTDLNGLSGGAPPVTIVLPSGERVQANFTGGWGEYRADGHYDFAADLTDPPSWLEIAGHRVELGPAAEPIIADIEQFGPEDRPMRYLWQLLADYNGEHNHSGLSNRAASDALLRAGLVSAEDPELSAALWVADTRAGQGPRMLRRHRRHGGPAPSSASVPAAVPAAWRSVLTSPVSGPGPEGIIALTVATPVFGHFSVALNALRSDRDKVTLTVTVAGSMSGAGGPTGWWAEDDRANHYLGHSGSWGGRDGHTGEIIFGPLDPKARRFTLAITSLDARAIIPIDLDWPAKENS